MNAREKILAMSVGVLVIGVLLYQVVWATLVDPYREARAEHREMLAERDELQQLQANRPKLEAQWQQVTTRTLAPTADRAQALFLQDVRDLLVEAGFANLNLRKPSVTAHPLYRYGGFQEVSIAVEVRGTLASLSRFLKMFYERPYFGSIDRLAIKVDPATAAARDRRRQPNQPVPEPMLEVSMHVCTVVLPKVLNIKPQSYPPDPNSLPERLEQSDEVYRTELVAANPFKMYVEPQRVVVRPPDPDPNDQIEEPVDEGPIEVVQPPPRRPNKVVVGVEAINGHYFAYVQDYDDLASPREDYTLLEEFDDGELVLVHRKGVVVRVPEVADPQAGGELYFYALGGNFQDREPLTPAEHPDVWAAYQAAQQPS